MSRVRGTLAALLCVGLGALPAGSPASAAPTARSAAAKREVSRAYGGFARSVAAGNGRAACARLSASGRAEVMNAAGVWSRWRGTCAEAVKELRGVLGAAAPLRDIRIFGVRASGRVAPDNYRFFVRAGRGWKVAGSAGSNVLLGPAPAPPATAPAHFLGIDWPRAQRWVEDATRWRWFAPAAVGLLLLVALWLALRARRLRRQNVALQQTLEEITARANRVLSSAAAPATLTLPPEIAHRLTAREDVAALARANRELTARLDEVQARADEMTKRMLDELSRTGDDHDQAARLRERLARSESARGEAHAEIQALQDHVRRLRERAQLPD